MVLGHQEHKENKPYRRFLIFSVKLKNMPTNSSDDGLSSESVFFLEDAGDDNRWIVANRIDLE